MLMGEHAVVYGMPCIVTAIDTRLTVSLEESEDKEIIFDTKGIKDTRFLDEVLRIAKREFGELDKGFTLTTSSGFSGKYGFGSSSALVVAALKALSHAHKKNLSPKELFTLAYSVVLSVQGTGSGFDVAAATYGGILLYVKGGVEMTPITVNSLPLVIGYTGVKADTVSIVRDVAVKREKEREKVDKIFNAIGKLVREAHNRMIEGDWERVGKLFDFNQEYLRNLGISSDKLESMISAAKGAGAWGAKLSGAGGGDCMIALVDPKKRSTVEDAIEKAGGEVVRIGNSAQGVRQETTDDQEELFVVVDEKDTIIGYRSRRDCHHDKTLIHRSIGVAVFDDRGRVLLQKRSSTKDLQPGTWDISAGGHVAKGESYEKAAKRELFEELGIDVTVKLSSKELFADDSETEMQVLFTSRCNGPFRHDPDETEKVEFVDRKELPRKLLSKEIILSTWAERSLKRLGYL